jgi:hypothetical protein
MSSSADSRSLHDNTVRGYSKDSLLTRTATAHPARKEGRHETACEAGDKNDAKQPPNQWPVGTMSKLDKTGNETPGKDQTRPGIAAEIYSVAVRSWHNERKGGASFGVKEDG